MTGIMYLSFDDFLSQASQLGKGPVALIFVEDDVEIATTLRHHLDCGFKHVVALTPDAFDIPKDVASKVHRVPFDCTPQNAVANAVNDINARVPQGCWLYYCYNAEFLFYPFCETRTVGEMLAFHTEERRDAMLTYVIDLYAGDLPQTPSAVSLDQAHLDKSGYYAQARKDPETGHPCERQLDFFGGVRWRYEEHIPQASRKIDRIALFKSKPGLKLQGDHTFNDQEYNTFSCPWHHNLTAAICSFRTAKALRRNPGSRFEIDSFRWHNSTPFEWHSRQLLDLGLMEPGQWF
ncbi:glycosyltransferase family 2 protein [Epibacterium ulvae]|uniref:glycosyltransferase family 2 protein n=1 Tax=Epibacterium ulvae TaxID=1156985 RepID=UPI00203DC1A1|nr:glycosyltransferase family 2 protein [Epibacterium ulvae]